MSGQEDPYAPHLAVTGTPWPGTVAVYSSIEDAGYELNTLIRAQSVIGETLSPMWAVRSGIWDRGPAVRVQLANRALESAAQARVLNGANLMAIGTPGSDQWELFQFADAVPVEAGIWDLSLRLRGQLGTDALMPEVWPEGSAVVLLDGTPTQIALPASARGLSRHYRIGSALRCYDDPSYVHEIAAFSGNGLRPLSPCHLKMVETATGWTFGWVRRTRIDGDSWDGYDVPLGEGQELYLVRVLEGRAVRREAVVSNPWWSYSTIEKLVDGISGDFALSVAQISQEYGPGLFETLPFSA